MAQAKQRGPQEGEEAFQGLRKAQGRREQHEGKIRSCPTHLHGANCPRKSCGRNLLTAIREALDKDDRRKEADVGRNVPKAKKAKLDMAQLGERIMRRKQELQANPNLLSTRG
jgi:hypothetical protein